MAEISASLIKDLVEYDPLRGTFVWKFRPVSMFKSEKFQKIWNTRFANQKAFSVDNKAGYLKGAVLGKEYLAHRVAWAVYHGSWPCGEIDHINGNRSDNRISNLREASRTENARNCTNTGSFGYSGVIYEAKLRKFRARIMADRKSHHIGLYGCPTVAAICRDKAALRLHGEFAYLNFPKGAYL